ncbi:MAG: hypothetical protein O7A98_11840 [Acidobacteria bacterium]|nr:hypothetical protein [Acidobacteriota bacterium]
MLGKIRLFFEEMEKEAIDQVLGSAVAAGDQLVDPSRFVGDQDRRAAVAALAAPSPLDATGRDQQCRQAGGDGPQGVASGSRWVAVVVSPADDGDDSITKSQAA